MICVLKNPLRQHIKGWFRGREVIFKSKAGLSFNMDDEEEAALYHYWKQTYGFLYDLDTKESDFNETNKNN